MRINRSLRTAPGLRAIGKHWEMDSLSSDIDSDSDISQKAVSICIHTTQFFVGKVYTWEVVAQPINFNDFFIEN